MRVGGVGVAESHGIGGRRCGEGGIFDGRDEVSSVVKDQRKEADLCDRTCEGRSKQGGRKLPVVGGRCAVEVEGTEIRTDEMDKAVAHPKRGGDDLMGVLGNGQHARPQEGGLACAGVFITGDESAIFAGFEAKDSAAMGTLEGEFEIGSVEERGSSEVDVVALGVERGGCVVIGRMDTLEPAGGFEIGGKSHQESIASTRAVDLVVGVGLIIARKGSCGDQVAVEQSQLPDAVVVVRAATCDSLQKDPALFATVVAR